MTLGLFQKIVLADTMLSGAADRVFTYPGPLVALDSWAGVLAFAGQIFFDFAGYSLCAIGAALTLGFHLKDNFRFPYAAIGFSDFWLRSPTSRSRAECSVACSASIHTAMRFFPRVNYCKLEASPPV